MRPSGSEIRAWHAVHGSEEGVANTLFNDGGSIFMTGSVASVKGFLVTACMRRARRRCAHSPMRTWLNELKGRNIRVNVLSPGPIDTPMQDQVLTEEAEADVQIPDPARERWVVLRRVQRSRCFWLQTIQSFVNGVELSVDGGFSAI